MEYKSKFTGEEIDARLDAVTGLVSNVMQAYEMPKEFVAGSWTLELTRQFEEWAISQKMWGQQNGSNLVVVKDGDKKQFMMYSSAVDLNSNVVQHEFTLLPLSIGAVTTVYALRLSAPAAADGTATEAFKQTIEVYNYSAIS